MWATLSRRWFIPFLQRILEKKAPTASTCQREAEAEACGSEEEEDDRAGPEVAFTHTHTDLSSPRMSHVFRLPKRTVPGSLGLMCSSGRSGNSKMADNRF